MAEFERKVLLDINARVENVINGNDDPVRKKEDSENCWTRISPERFGQIIVLDGDRGTGKTSLLLTILDEWLKGWRRKESTEGPKEVKELEDKLRRIGKAVRPLQILDFDPLPDPALRPIEIFAQ